MNNYSLFELNEYIRRIMALNFKEKLWVKGEVSQINESKGHFYLNLIEKAEGGEMIIAESQAVIWGKDYRRLQRKLRKQLATLLREGMFLLMQVRVEYHERYGLKLIIEDIDPTYSIGQLELQRRATIATLEKLDLLGLNQSRVLPPAVQKIALISSPNAAGLQDYVTQLQENEYGYHFDNHLFPAAVQGLNAEREILNQLKKIIRRADDFEAIVIIRGGGARLDLMAFDSLELSKVIAQCPLPVLTGIGHDINESVIDLVAYQALKTPTAVADFLVQHNLRFESHVHLLGQELQGLVKERLQQDQLYLQNAGQVLRLKSESMLLNQQRLLSYMEEEIPRQAQVNIKNQQQALKQLEQIVYLLSPEASLKRGFSMTLKDGKVVQSVEELEEGDRLTTVLRDGVVESEVRNLGEE